MAYIDPFFLRLLPIKYLSLLCLILGYKLMLVKYHIILQLSLH